MRLRTLVLAAAMSIAGLFGSVSASFAADAVATTALNVRSGPGTGYGVVGVLQANQVVQILQCNGANTWCEVQDRTLRGWASSRYLRPVEGGGPGTPTRPAPPVISGQPGVGITINTPNFSFSIGSGRPLPPTAAGRICFFEQADYAGRSFCAIDGDGARVMERFWDDRIRSARVEGNISATVCTRTNFNGRCAVIDRSVRNLGSLADDISSFYVTRR